MAASRREDPAGAGRGCRRTETGGSGGGRIVVAGQPKGQRGLGD